MKKKCPTCGEVKLFKDFTKNKKYKNGLGAYCKKCFNERITKRRNTERGYLKMRYDSMIADQSRTKRWGRRNKCHFTFEEFLAAWEKHKSIYGMRSAWGPHHLPITMIYLGTKENNNKRTGSNLSPDRLDSSKPYTIQNLIFIRNDENLRKKDTTYEDCLTQIKLHEERFINMEAI